MIRKFFLCYVFFKIDQKKQKKKKKALKMSEKNFLIKRFSIQQVKDVNYSINFNPNWN